MPNLVTTSEERMLLARWVTPRFFSSLVTRALGGGRWQSWRVWKHLWCHYWEVRERGEQDDAKKPKGTCVACLLDGRNRWTIVTNSDVVLSYLEETMKAMMEKVSMVVVA